MLTLVLNLDDVAREARLDLLVHKSVGHRVEMSVDLHVVVDVHARLLPIGVLEASCR